MAEKQQILSPDLSLIHPYTREDSEKYTPVVFHHFHNGKKDLYYMASTHVSGINNPTCKTVELAIDKYKPQVVVVEGLPTEEGFSPESFLEGIKKEMAGSHITSGEPPYVAYLAQQRNIPFIGGEPADTALFKAMEERGYPAKDVMAFYVLHWVPQDKREGLPMDESSFAERSKHRLSEYSHNGETLIYEEFKAWYEKHKTGNKHYLDIGIEDIIPYSSPGANYFQKLNSHTGILRDQNVLNTISSLLAHNDRVMVVYGNGHIVRSRPVLENMFQDKGEVIQLVPDNGKAGAEDSRKNKEPKIHGFARVMAVAAGAAGVVTAAGLVIDKILNHGKAGRKIADTLKAWVNR